MEITKIVRQANEALPEIKERWTDEASSISGVPKIMQISSFIDGCKNPELAKRFAEKVPQTVTEMLVRVDDFIRSEKAFRSAEVPRGEKIDNYRRDSHQNTYQINDLNAQWLPFRGGRKCNDREEFWPRRNDHYVPYGPARNEGSNRPDYRRNDLYRRETRPIDLNALTKAP